MVTHVKRMWSGLDLEERILNGAVIFSLASIFFPWLTGEWLGSDPQTYTGFGSYTSFIGIAVFTLLILVLLITLIPLVGGPVIFRKRTREIVRLCLASQVTVLLLAALSVLMKVTYEFRSTEIRFGIYATLIGSIVVTIYASIRWQEVRKNEPQELFHHPEDHHPVSERHESHIAPPPMPPPPPPLEPEELHLRG